MKTVTATVATSASACGSRLCSKHNTAGKHTLEPLVSNATHETDLLAPELLSVVCCIPDVHALLLTRLFTPLPHY